MNKYHLKIEYDGSNFVGWQYQKNGLSVQEILQKALSKFLKENIVIIGSGRTDQGVHAYGQVASLKISQNINLEGLFNILLAPVSVFLYNFYY